MNTESLVSESDRRAAAALHYTTQLLSSYGINPHSTSAAPIIAVDRQTDRQTDTLGVSKYVDR